jgi:ABC-type sugar transport system substrate-binding protein
MVKLVCSAVQVIGATRILNLGFSSFASGLIRIRKDVHVRSSMKQLLTVALAGVLLTGIASACSSGKTSSTGGTSSSSTGASSVPTTNSSVESAAMAYAAAHEATNVPLPMPTTKVALGKHKVAEINVGLNSPTGLQIAPFFDAALKATGWTYSTFDGGLSPTKIGGYIRQAIQEKFDAIIIEATDIDTITAPAQEAINAGITLICMVCHSTGPLASKVIDVNSDWTTQGKALAAATIARHGLSTSIVRWNEPAYISVVSVTQGVKEGMQQFCPSCKADYQNFSVDSLTTPGPPAWTAYLAQHPAGSFTDVLAAFDYQATILQSTATQASRSDVVISSSASLAPFIASIENGSDKGFATVDPMQWEVWASVDEVVRALAKQPAWNAQNAYAPVLTPANASKFLPLGVYTPDGVNIPAAFQALWTA